MTGIGVAYVLISARLVINVPILHFLWIVGSLFLAFYAIGAMPDYGTSVTFAILISAGLPLGTAMYQPKLMWRIRCGSCCQR